MIFLSIFLPHGRTYCVGNSIYLSLCMLVKIYVFNGNFLYLQCPNKHDRKNLLSVLEHIPCYITVNTTQLLLPAFIKKTMNNRWFCLQTATPSWDAEIYSYNMNLFY